jgi:Rod binding domain-containing protein
MQDIRKPVLATAESNSTVNGIYSDMINNQMADSISRSGTFGLARSLQGQLGHQVLPHSKDTLASSPKSS